MNGRELQKRIRMSGKTQKELAEKMGMHPTQFTTYFKQESVASGVLEDIAKILGMSMGEFYGECSGISNRSELLRNLSIAAMQGLLAAGPNFDNETMKNKSYEQCIAELAVKQAICMFDQFKIAGIDK